MCAETNPRKATLEDIKQIITNAMGPIVKKKSHSRQLPFLNRRFPISLYKDGKQMFSPLFGLDTHTLSIMGTLAILFLKE